MSVNLCSSRVEWVRNPELMESSDDASSSPLAGGACFPRGIITTLGPTIQLSLFSETFDKLFRHWSGIMNNVQGGMESPKVNHL